MATPVNMPQVGQDLETALLAEWHVKEGDHVNKGDIIATVESDKASFEVEAFEAGTMLKLLINEGEEGYVFKPIAYLGEPGETIPGYESGGTLQGVEPAGKHGLIPSDESGSIGELQDQEFSSGTGKIYSSPSARRIAAEHKVDISLVKPTGPDKRIIKKDVLAYVAASEQIKVTPVAREMARAEGIGLDELSGTGPQGRIRKTDVLSIAGKKIPTATATEEDEEVIFDKVRKVIAERLSLSKQTIPHYYLNIDVDVENVLKLKKRILNESGIKVSVNDILVYTVAQVLPRYKWLNAHVDHEKVIIKGKINIGVAITTEAGLFVPVLEQANRKKLIEISAEIEKLASDARRGIVNPVPQATFTISNLGMFGISGFEAIINPPECAILSIGGIERKVIPVENGLKITDMMNIGMAVDHRAVDGSYAARFLNDLKTELINLKI